MLAPVTCIYWVTRLHRALAGVTPAAKLSISACNRRKFLTFPERNKHTAFCLLKNVNIVTDPKTSLLNRRKTVLYFLNCQTVTSLFKYIHTYKANRIAYMNKSKITKLLGLGR